MKISSALKELKNLRNELKRKLNLRKDNFTVIIPKRSELKDETNYVNFDEITDEILNLVCEISQIRERIQKTNLTTTVKINDGKTEISLAILKLFIDDLRSELAQIQVLTRGNRLFSFDRRKITTTDEEEKEVAQKSDLQIEEIIKQLEEKKTEYENLLEFTNATTELVEDDSDNEISIHANTIY